MIHVSFDWDDMELNKNMYPQLPRRAMKELKHCSLLDLEIAISMKRLVRESLPEILTVVTKVIPKGTLLLEYPHTWRNMPGAVASHFIKEATMIWASWVSASMAGIGSCDVVLASFHTFYLMQPQRWWNFCVLTLWKLVEQRHFWQKEALFYEETEHSCADGKYPNLSKREQTGWTCFVEFDHDQRAGCIQRRLIWLSIFPHKSSAQATTSKAAC